ncbi:MAG: ABC transporter substrate-binding protein [Bacteroidetes bacterium]|nr:ABC transporter substrate-binding protein [Bacteroidota bacterium]MDA1120205.1 ABC transporter substrate-binding protein [Bacteroidota bacterium]
MAKMHLMRLRYFLFTATCFLCNCKQEYSSSNEVRIAIGSNPENLNPLFISSVIAREVALKANEQIEIVNPFTLKIEPSVGELIELTDLGDGICQFAFRISKKAKWNSGISITKDDIILSIKLYKLPEVTSPNIRLNLSDIITGRIDAIDQQIIRINVEGFCSNQRSSFVDFYILPKHIFDPYGYLDGVSIQEINERSNDLSTDSRISTYVKYFNSEEFTDRLKNHSAKYAVTRVETGQFIELTKQPDWWGFGLDKKYLTSISNPDKIIYYIIPEDAVALIALKNGEIDVVENVAPYEFKNLSADDFVLLEPLLYRFGFIAFNTRVKKLTKPVRKAISMIFPYHEIIDVALQSYGVRTVGPIFPKDSIYYNFDLEMDNKNLEEAAKILQRNGFEKVGEQWVDMERNPLSFRLSYALGVSKYHSASLIIKQALVDFGIGVELEGVENSLLFSRLKTHDFEMAIWGFSGGPFAHNFAPIFGLEASAVGGLNYTGFGNQESDSIINAINIAQSNEAKSRGLLRL